MDKTRFIMFLVVLSTLSLVLATNAQTVPVFTSTTSFPVPAYNGNISFAGSGSYETATLENDTWTFTGLNWNGASGKLGVSAQNCNMTITGYEPGAVTTDGAWLNYTLEGEGSQTVNLRYDTHGFPTILKVYIDGAAKPENDGWNISDNGRLTVTTATANVSIRYRAVPPPDADYNPSPSQSIIDQTPLFLIVGLPIAAIIVMVTMSLRAKIKRKNQLSS